MKAEGEHSQKKKHAGDVVKVKEMAAELGCVKQPSSQRLMRDGEACEGQTRWRLGRHLIGACPEQTSGQPGRGSLRPRLPCARPRAVLPISAEGRRGQQPRAPGTMGPTCWFFNNTPPLHCSFPSFTEFCLLCPRSPSFPSPARHASTPFATRCPLLLTLDLTLFDRPFVSSQRPRPHTVPFTCCQPARNRHH